MGTAVADQLNALDLKEERSPEQAVLELVRVIGEAIETTEDAGVQRDVACSASAAIVALEAAKAVSTAVIASCAKDVYSERVKASFTVLLSSSSTVESLHMLGGITANSMLQAEQQGDGDVRPWESKPLVFWDSNVTFYVTATQTMEDLHDITIALGLKSDTSEVREASPLELVYETLTTDELWSLVNMAHEARLLGVTGAREIQLTILLYLDDENAVVVKVLNGPEGEEWFTAPKHKKNPDVGIKVVLRMNEIIIDQADARAIGDGEECTLMGWGNAIFKNIVKEGDVITSMECDINPDGDIKSTKLKMTWLANWNELVPVIMKDFDYMITKRKPEDTDEFEDIVNQKTEICTAAKGDGNLRAYNKGEVIQIERKGYFVVDRPSVSYTHLTLPTNREV